VIGRAHWGLDPLWLLLGSALALGFLVVAVGAIAVLPADLLLLKPDHREFASQSERLSVALTRWTVLTSFAILTLWCLLPGVARAVPLTIHRANIRKPQSLIRKVKRARIKRADRITLGCLVLGAAAVALSSLIGIVIRFPQPGLATLMSVVVCASIGWLVWRVGLRLLRHRARLIGPFSCWEYLWPAIAVLGAASIIPLASEQSIGLSAYLPLLGPLGWQLAALRDLGEGHVFGLIPLSGVVVTTAWLGWLVAKDAGSWTNRRKLIESQRLLLNAPIEPAAASQRLGHTELLARIRRDLDATMVGRRTRSWRFWLTPNWLRRYLRWYLLLVAMMLVFQAVLWPMHVVVASVDPVAAIGDLAVRPELSLIAMMAVPLAMLFSALEILALYDRVTATLNSAEARPVSTLGLLLEVHRDGLLRLPIQLILLSPLLPLAWASGSFADFEYQIPLVGLGILLFVRTLAAMLMVICSLRPVMPGWARMSIDGALTITIYGALVAALVMTSRIWQSRIDPVHALLLLVFANLIMCGSYALVTWPRRRRAPLRA
jgi:hypothetical protein